MTNTFDFANFQPFQLEFTPDKNRDKPLLALAESFHETHPTISAHWLVDIVKSFLRPLTRRELIKDLSAAHDRKMTKQLEVCVKQLQPGSRPSERYFDVTTGAVGACHRSETMLEENDDVEELDNPETDFEMFYEYPGCEDDPNDEGFRPNELKMVEKYYTHHYFKPIKTFDVDDQKPDGPTQGIQDEVTWRFSGGNGSFSKCVNRMSIQRLRQIHQLVINGKFKLCVYRVLRNGCHHEDELMFRDCLSVINHDNWWTLYTE